MKPTHILTYRISVVLIAVLLITGCTKKSTTQPEPKPGITLTEFTGENLDSIISDQIRKSYSAGDEAMVAVSVYRQDSLGNILDSAFFFSNEGHPLPSANTIFRIGSVTKTFTAFLVAQMAAVGRMNLEAPAQNYLPLNQAGIQDVKLPDQFNGLPVTISSRDLSIYGSGLQRNAPVTNGATPYDSMFSYLNHAELLFAPGNQCYLYSNLGWAVLGLIPPYQEFPDDPHYYNRWFEVLHNRLLGPLAMNDTRLELTAEQQLRRARGYPTDDGNPNWPANLAAGGLYSSITDMRIYQKMMMGMDVNLPFASVLDTLLQLRSFAWSDTCATQANHYGSKLGMAWFHNQIPDTQISFYWKDGAVPGFGAFITFSGPDEHPVGVIIMANNEQFPVQSLAESIHKWLATGSLVI